MIYQQHGNKRRVILPGYPHHQTQPGNLKGRFCEDDYQYYLEWLKMLCQLEKVDMGILFDEQSCSPCVKPNKISNHRVAETLMHYTRIINFREKWRGYLWQGRFASFPMDENGLFRSAC